VDLYTLNPFFLPERTIDDFVSVVWTERYSAAGDVRLIVPATYDMVQTLKEGTFLAQRGTKEVMLLETQSIENGLLTVVGSSLLDFLDERAVWSKNPFITESNPSKILDYTETGKPGQVIANVVSAMVISPADFTGVYTNVNLEWGLEDIQHLSLGPVDTSGSDVRISIPVGPLYSGIKTVAEQYGVGISLYLESADPVTGYSLKFTTYQGVDRTSDGEAELIRLVPDMDTLSDVKELRSIAEYKNVVYVYYQDEVSVHYEDPDNPPEGFNRRILVTNAEGAPVGRKGTYTNPWGFEREYTELPTAADFAAFRAQNARDALANHNYIRAIDGQTSPTNEFQFGVDYFLGDLIELEGLTGNLGKARITEFIRTRDESGEKSYPTISVVS